VIFGNFEDFELQEWKELKVFVRGLGTSLLAPH